MTDTALEAPVLVHGAPAITVADMQAKLLSMADVRAQLEATEPLTQLTFTTGDDVRFRIDNWFGEAIGGDDMVSAWVRIGHGETAPEFQLSRDALEEAAALCSIPRTYTRKCPASLMQDQLNYWFRGGLGAREFKFLAVGADHHGKAFTRGTIQPFSNVRLLDEALAAIENQYGTSDGVLADYKFSHTLRRTYMRLIVPEVMRTMERTGTENDTWSTGIQIRNSLIGEFQTSIDGYLFRWWCTNGAIDTTANSGTWNRRAGQGEDVYDWARGAVDEVLGGLEHSLDAVQAMVDVPVNEDVNQVLKDIFATYKVPLATREEIINAMVADDQLTMYSVMQAVTRCANESGLEPHRAEEIMRVGGDLPRAAHARCNECHRIQR